VNSGQLRWRCRRGLKELDMLLERYLDQQYASSSPQQQQAFRQLLSWEDPALYRLLCAGESANTLDQASQQVVSAIRAVH